MFEIPLTSLTLSTEGSVTCHMEPPEEAEEHGACVRDGLSKLNVNARDEGEPPRTWMEVEEGRSVQREPSEGVLQSGFSCFQQEMENSNVREMEEKPTLSGSVEVLQNVGVPRSCEAKDIFQPARVRKLYPQLPAEVAEVPSLVAVKPLLCSQRLYPELPSQPELAPFTKEQLRILEPGSWLENVESYEEEFDSMAHQDRHEFYELLLNYSRCRKQLLLAEAELLTLTADCQNAKSRLWHFKEEQVSVQVI